MGGNLTPSLDLDRHTAADELPRSCRQSSMNTPVTSPEAGEPAGTPPRSSPTPMILSSSMATPTMFQMSAQPGGRS